jgi:hypothetical protein
LIRFTCPCCGADFPWEAGLVEADAKRLGAVLGDMEPPLARAAMSYLRLFKPPKTTLRLPRATKLLQELSALVAEGTVCRDERSGVRRPAPASAWVAGIEQMLQQSDRLTLPLTAHGYLRQVVFGIADAADAAAEKMRVPDVREGRRPAGPSPSRPPEDKLTNELAYLAQMLRYGRLTQDEYDAQADQARARHGSPS